MEQLSSDNSSCHQEEISIQSPAFQALTIGVPFCIFKLLFGCLSIRAAVYYSPLYFLGWLIVAWASADLLMNLSRVIFNRKGKESPVEYCTIAQAGRIFNRPRLFLALDTFLTFSIICLALRSGWIKHLSRHRSPSVVCCYNNEPHKPLSCKYLA